MRTFVIGGVVVGLCAGVGWEATDRFGVTVFPILITFGYAVGKVAVKVEEWLDDLGEEYR
jgi:hypothetical protein